MTAFWTRREFINTAGRVAASLGGLAATRAPAAAATAVGAAAAEAVRAPRAHAALPFRISLAQWSFHRALRAGELDHLDFARLARQDYGIEAIEYVNVFFKDRAQDATYLAEMNRRAADHGVYQHLVMCDGEGRLGDPDAALRRTAVENHYKWVDAARTLGCAMIRVNAASRGSWEEQAALAADGLRRLTEHAEGVDISIVVENHGGLSNNGKWLAEVMRRVDHPRCGTLPDFGNFRISADEVYDRYLGVAELMPFAKGVSAKSHDFDEQGNEREMDYRRLMRIVTDAGYNGWVGIEYEGSRLGEREGVAATLRLLETVRTEMMTP
jgi:L-ribulose-5-phosphate 3-epimerase